jgi:hypothetical protein
VGLEGGADAGAGVGGLEVGWGVDGAGAEDAREKELGHHGVGSFLLTPGNGEFGWLVLVSQFRCGHSCEFADAGVEFEEQVAEDVVGGGGLEQADGFQDEGQDAAFRAEGGKFGIFDVAEGFAEAGAGFGVAESQSERGRVKALSCCSR